MIKLFLALIVVSSATSEPGLWDYLGDVFDIIVDSVVMFSDDGNEAPITSGGSSRDKSNAQRFMDYLKVTIGFEDFLKGKDNYMFYQNVVKTYSDLSDSKKGVEFYDQARYILYSAIDRSLVDYKGLITQTEYDTYIKYVDMYMDQVEKENSLGY